MLFAVCYTVTLNSVIAYFMLFQVCVARAARPCFTTAFDHIISKNVPFFIKRRQIRVRWESFLFNMIRIKY